jgi:hypothetical protein
VGVGSPQAWGDIPIVLEPSPLFTGKSIPEPPQQHAKWEPPKSKVPKWLVSATTHLFDHGLADPRGCEYRDIAVTTGSCWTGDAGVVRTRGWVLPARKDDKNRYAVCWNGLVYPLVSVGDKANLQQDVKMWIENSKEEKNRDENTELPQSEEGRSLLPGRWDILNMAQLLRLGEVDLLSKLWGDNDSAKDLTEFYQLYAKRWSWTQFDRALGAHMRGDNALALYAFRQLSTFAEKVKAEEQKRGVDEVTVNNRYLDIPKQLPELLADQERRAKDGTHEAVVCIGPGRHPDQKKRIASLIDRLDEVNERQWGQPGGVNLGNDPIIQALIREGEPALEPLLRCFEEDRRLTRSVHFWRDFTHNRTCLGVHEAAYVALSGILSRSDFAPRSTGDDLTTRGDETRKKLAEMIREHVKTAKRLPPAQRWFAILMDDRVKPGEWVAAARRLVSPEDIVVAPGTMVWTGSAVRLRPPQEEKSKLVGEPLRGKTDPSVSDLLVKRIGQCDDHRHSAYLALALSEWEPKTALKSLAEQMKRIRENNKWSGYVEMVERRCELGDLKALDDYVDFMLSFTPGMLGDIRYPNQFFYPMADHPDYPGMAAVAKKLFSDPQSPWLPLVRKGALQGLLIHELITTNLLRVPAFRDEVIKELGNKGGDGTIRVDKYGKTDMDLPGVTNSSGGPVGDWRELLDVPEEGAGDKFRICDFIAWQISEKFEAAPRCELYWSEEKRDKAVAACVAFLRQYGDHLFLQQKVLVHNKPATPQDVRNGKAIFSLDGEGVTRTVAGLKLPLDVRWLTLRNRPYQEIVTDPKSGKKIFTTFYRQDGRIVQAEEVLQDGKWQRYYGFVGSNHVARVPAEDIEFPPEERWVSRQRRQPHDWADLGLGFHAKLIVPNLTIELFDNLPPRLPAGADLAFSITLRNSRGLDQDTPAPEQSVRLRLLYSEESLSPKGSLVPNALKETEWVEIPFKVGAQFKSEKKKLLAPTEETKLATVDLRTWFDMSKPGFYRLQLLPVRDLPKAGSAVPAEIHFSMAAQPPKPDAK